jgi:glycerophosphoryl diester phosphodiesterase
MQVLSHRGYHQQLPENTLSAFEAAIAMGVDGIETDLRLTSDGQLILFHDRLTPDHRPIHTVTRVELAFLCKHQVATADEALEKFPQVLWNLEIKTPEVVPAAIELIERYRSSHRLLITSFWHTAVEQIAESCEVECGLLVSHRPLLASAAPFQPFGLTMAQRNRPLHDRVTSLVWCYEFLDAAAIEQAWQAGFRNYCYGVNTPEEHRHCDQLGLDGLITDRPEFVLPFRAT